MYRIRKQLPSDESAIEALYDRVFGKDRRSRISYRYREGIAPLEGLCLAAEAEGTVVGAIRFWPVRFEREPALLLGPLAIAPEHHGRGVGRALLAASLTRIARRPERLVFLVGDPDYYRRRGFSPVPSGVVMPGADPARLLWRVLRGPAPERGMLRRADGRDIRELEDCAADPDVPGEVA